MNYFTKLSRFILYLSLIFNSGSLVLPANAHLQPNYYLIAQSPKSRQDLLTEIASEKDTMKRIEAVNLLIQTYPDFADAYKQSPIIPSEQDGKFRLAISYYNQGLIMSKTNKVQSIRLLNMALLIFVNLDDKIYEQKAVAAINSEVLNVSSHLS